jgi:hypothetical protein
MTYLLKRMTPPVQGPSRMSKFDILLEDFDEEAEN